MITLVNPFTDTESTPVAIFSDFAILAYEVESHPSYWFEFRQALEALGRTQTDNADTKAEILNLVVKAEKTFLPCFKHVAYYESVDSFGFSEESEESEESQVHAVATLVMCDGLKLNVEYTISNGVVDIVERDNPSGAFLLCDDCLEDLKRAILGAYDLHKKYAPFYHKADVDNTPALYDDTKSIRVDIDLDTIVIYSNVPDAESEEPQYHEVLAYLSSDSGEHLITVPIKFTIYYDPELGCDDVAAFIPGGYPVSFALARHIINEHFINNGLWLKIRDKLA